MTTLHNDPLKPPTCSGLVGPHSPQLQHPPIPSQEAGDEARAATGGAAVVVDRAAGVSKAGEAKAAGKPVQTAPAAAPTAAAKVLPSAPAKGDVKKAADPKPEAKAAKGEAKAVPDGKKAGVAGGPAGVAPKGSDDEGADEAPEGPGGLSRKAKKRRRLAEARAGAEGEGAHATLKGDLSVGLGLPVKDPKVSPRPARQRSGSR